MLRMHVAAVSSRMENDTQLFSYTDKFTTAVLNEGNLHRTEIPLALCTYFY